jgi:hypothetical protein
MGGIGVKTSRRIGYGARKSNAAFARMSRAILKPDWRNMQTISFNGIG